MCIYLTIISIILTLPENYQYFSPWIEPKLIQLNESKSKMYNYRTDSRI